MLHIYMHAAGYVLDLKYQSPDNGQHSNVEVMRGFHNIVEKLLPNVEDQVKAIEQLAKYRNSEGVFGRPLSRQVLRSCPVGSGGWNLAQSALSCRAWRKGAEPHLMHVYVREKLEHLRLYPQQKAQSSATRQGKRSGGGVL